MKMAMTVLRKIQKSQSKTQQSRIVLPQQQSLIQKLIRRAEQTQKITSSTLLEKVNDDMMLSAVFVSTRDPISLNKTLTSFYKFNTYYLQDIIVIYSKEYSEQLASLLIRFPQVKWIIVDKKLQKMEALDQAQKLVTTPYIFYSDDNYQFVDEGFIQKSIELFKTNPDLVQVQIIKDFTKINSNENSNIDNPKANQFNLTPGLHKMKEK